MLASKNTMRSTLAAILLLAAPLASAAQLPDDSLTKGLLNLATMQQIATALDYQRVVHDGYRLGPTPAETATLLAIDPAQLTDPWGTPYRIELTETSYRIVGAGSDHAFEEKTWETRAETTTLAADVVLAGGTFVRTNRAWLLGFVTEAQKGEHALPTAFPRGNVYPIVNTPGKAWMWLRINELEAEAAKNDPKLDLMRSRITQQHMLELAAFILKYREKYQTVRGCRFPRVVDEWGVPLDVEFDAEQKHFRVISGGADKAFNSTTWTRQTNQSFDDDLVYDDTAWTRVLDLDTAAQAFLPPELQVNPRVASTKEKTAGGQTIYRVGGDVAAPIALVRSDVPYPPELEGRGKIGIAELVIDASGKVVDVKPMLGLSPAADQMIADAISRWEFQPATLSGKPVPVIYNVTLSLRPPR